MSPLAQEAQRTPDEVTGGIHYALHEDDYSRLHQVWEVLDFLSLLSEGLGTAVSLDHVAAVSGYAARDLNQALVNMVRCEPQR